MTETEPKRSSLTAMNSPVVEPLERELVITRIFAAPRELVWKAWKEPEHLKRWWGAKGFHSLRNGCRLPGCK